MTSPEVFLDFAIPKADMRMPNVDGFSFDDFVTSFWSRHVHPEIFKLRMVDMELQMLQNSFESFKRNESPAPISFSVSSNYVDITFEVSIVVYHKSA